MKISKFYLKQIIKEALSENKNYTFSQMSNEELVSAPLQIYRALIKKIHEQYPDDYDLHQYIYEPDYSLSLIEKELLKRVRKNSENI